MSHEPGWLVVISYIGQNDWYRQPKFSGEKIACKTVKICTESRKSQQSCVTDRLPVSADHCYPSTISYWSIG